MSGGGQAMIGERMTADEFVARYSGRKLELIDGVVMGEPTRPQLVWSPGGGEAHAPAARAVRDFVAAADRGSVFADCPYVRRTAAGPDQTDTAAVCFFSHDRPPPVGPPALVIEVRTASEPWLAAFRKVPDYLYAGVRAVVVVDADTRTASVYRDDVAPKVFARDADLVLLDVLPGFAVRVASLFG